MLLSALATAPSSCLKWSLICWSVRGPWGWPLPDWLPAVLADWPVPPTSDWPATGAVGSDDVVDDEDDADGSDDGTADDEDAGP